MIEATLSIGQVAEQAGVNVSAIRFYERKQAGFSLKEVAVLLDSIVGPLRALRRAGLEASRLRESP